MSQVQLQGIARRLSAAGYAEHPVGEGEYLLHVDYVNDENYSLVSKHWTGYFFGSQELVSQHVRQDTPAAYIITAAFQHIVCISSLSTLRVLEYSIDEEEWVTTSISRYDLHHDGKFAACATEDGELHVFFQDPTERLIHLEIASGEVSVLPVRLAVGSPIFVDIVSDKVHVFYISSLDYRIHFRIVTPKKVSEENLMSECKVTEDLKQFMVEWVPGKEIFNAYVLTEGLELLYISGDGKKSVLGAIDATGEFVSEMQVDRCCSEAWNGTLVADRLEIYLNSNPAFINSPGGEHEITPLAAACWKGHIDIVKLLLSYGADPNALSPKNRTPLFYTTTRSPSKNRAAIVHALLNAGAEVDQCYADDNFNTPLMNAVMLFRDREVVRELLAHGASLAVRNGDGKTVGMLAKGTGLENELPQPRPQLLATSQPQSPSPQLPQRPTPRDLGEMQKQLIDILVSIVLLIVEYTNTEDILDEVLRRLRGIEGVADGA